MPGKTGTAAKNVAAVYDNWQGWDDASPLETKYSVYVPNLSVRAVLEFLETHPEYGHGPLLDCGCGHGAAANTLRNAGYQTVAVDLISHADTKNYIRASALQLPFHADSFRLVYALSVLHHVADIMAAIQEIASVLDSGGIFIMTLHTEKSVFTKERQWKRKKMPKLFPHLEDLHFHPEKKVHAALLKSGFEILKVDGIHYSYPVSHLMNLYARIAGAGTPNPFYRLDRFMAQRKPAEVRARKSYHAIYIARKKP